MSEITLHLDQEVEFAPPVARAALVGLPVGSEQQPRRPSQLPPGLLGDLTCQGLEQRLACLDMAAEHVPAIRQPHAIRATAMDEDAPTLVADQRTNHAAAARGFGLLLEAREVGRSHSAGRGWSGLITRPAAESSMRVARCRSRVASSFALTTHHVAARR